MNRKARLSRYRSAIESAIGPAERIRIASEYVQEAIVQAPADVAASTADRLVDLLIAEVGGLERQTPKSPPQPVQRRSFLPPRPSAAPTHRRTTSP